jgi:hypothetical protein
MLEMRVTIRVLVSGHRAMLPEAIRRFFEDCHLMMCRLGSVKDYVLPSTTMYEGHFCLDRGREKGHTRKNQAH